MSKELIERMKSYIPNGDGYNSQYANDLADAVDALESAAAPRQPVEWRCRVAGSDHYAHFPTKRCRFCEPLYTAPQPSSVLDGFVLVPVEPTRTMLHRAYDNNLMPWISRQSTGHDCAAGIWESMLAAAPSAPATGQGDAVAILDEVREFCRQAGYLDVVRRIDAIAAARQECGKV